jgi:DNA-directed RNA polymerase specialized sigma24 family protein
MATNYIDKKEFLDALIERYDILKTNPDYPISRYLGKCVLDICTRASYMPSFINYSYREEMIGDAIETCISAIDKFKVEKSQNPFGYFTQIAVWAFIRRIESEKRQQYLRGKMLLEIPLDEIMDMSDCEDELQVIQQMREQFYFNTEEYEAKREAKKKKIEANLNSVFEEEV